MLCPRDQSTMTVVLTKNRQCKTVASRTEAAREWLDTKPHVQAPAGESLAELQRQDPDISPIL